MSSLGNEDLGAETNQAVDASKGIFQRGEVGSKKKSRRRRKSLGEEGHDTKHEEDEDVAEQGVHGDLGPQLEHELKLLVEDLVHQVSVTSKKMFEVVADHLENLSATSKDEAFAKEDLGRMVSSLRKARPTVGESHGRLRSRSRSPMPKAESPLQPMPLAKRVTTAGHRKSIKTKPQKQLSRNLNQDLVPRKSVATLSAFWAMKSPTRRLSTDTTHGIAQHPSVKMRSDFRALDLTTKSVDHHFQEISNMINTEDDTFLDKVLDKEFEFVYKSRRCSGKAIHIAALHRGGIDIVTDILSRLEDGSEIQQQNCSDQLLSEYTFDSFGCLGAGQAIHLAAGAGNIEVLQSLITAEVDVNIKTKHGEEDNYTALHEAAYFEQSSAVIHLLEIEADPNVRNKASQSPLHVAAKIGSPEVVECLVKGNADLSVRDKAGKTSLMVAVDAGVFPPEELHLLARCCADDVKIVARVEPDAAVTILSDTRLTLKDDVKRQKWQQELGIHQDTVASTLVDEFTVNELVDLLKFAPKVAKSLLEVLTEEPRVKSAFHHPLYKHARLRNRQEIRCVYTEDKVWNYDTEQSGSYPSWHDYIAPGGGDVAWLNEFKQVRQAKTLMGVQTPGLLDKVSREAGEALTPDLLPVEIKCLRMENIIDQRVLHLLSHTSYSDIFYNQATEAILEYSWVYRERLKYNINLVQRLAELVLLICWTLSGQSSTMLWRFCWSVAFVSTLRDLVKACFQAYGYIFILESASSYFLYFWFYVDWFSIILSILFLWTSADKVTRPGLAAFTFFSRWIQLTYSLRAYGVGGLGTKILPILHTFADMTGMLVISVCTFCAFLHWILAVRGFPIDKSEDTFHVMFKLLWMAEADGGIDPLLEFGFDRRVQWLISFGVTFMFCLSLMNILIAVLNESYRMAYASSKAIFLQSRARICLRGMLTTFLSRLLPPLRAWHQGLMFILVVPIWASLLGIEEIPRIVPCLLLLIAVLISECSPPQAFYGRTRQDEADEAENPVLWWCTAAE